MGGEHRSAATEGSRQTGSSPRGRGTRDRDGRFPVHGRFIPAWAGNTADGVAEELADKVHPRVGGEHTRANLPPDSVSGSSPRGRGTPLWPRLGLALIRFIPAWAGNTAVAQVGISLDPVHPRVGGEHQREAQPAEPDTRFIPAWAGNTCTQSTHARPEPVHPRVGGEHPRLTRPNTKARGSSPRGRGTQYFRVHQLAPFRFIPAWAGNTSTSLAGRRLGSVHPRVGGEHAIDDSNGRNSCRFIPAWAGNTPAPTPETTAPPVHPRVGGEHRTHVAVNAGATGSSPRGRGTRHR